MPRRSSGRRGGEEVLMGEMADESVEVLDASVDPMPEEGDHPDDLTDDEALAGDMIYREVDDLDDDSNGLD
jgi:hypothetical protein